MKPRSKLTAALVGVLLALGAATYALDCDSAAPSSEHPSPKFDPSRDAESLAAPAPAPDAVEEPAQVPGADSLRFVAGQPPVSVAVSLTAGAAGVYPPLQAQVGQGSFWDLPAPVDSAGEDTARSAWEIYARSADGEHAYWANLAATADLDDTGRVLALSPAASLAVEVVDPDGAPLAGANVRVSRGLIGLVHLTQSTDEDGGAEFPAIPPGDYRLTVQAAGFVARSRPLLHTARLPGGRDTLRVVLDRGATVAGRVVDTAGRPVAGAQVEAIAVSPFADEILDADFLAQVGVASQVARAGADGRFILAGLDIGALQLRAEAPGYAAGLSELMRVQASGRQPSVDIVLRREATRDDLLVRVQTSDPQVQVDAVYLQVDTGADAGRRCVGSHLRAADWRFNNCGRGARTLVATTRDGVELRWTGEFSETTEVILDAPGRLEIFVVDAQGAPVNSSLVQLWRGAELLLEADSRGSRPLTYLAAPPLTATLVALDARRGAALESVALETAPQAPPHGARRYVMTLNRDILGVAQPPGIVRDLAVIQRVTRAEVVRDGRSILFDMIAPDSPAGRAGVQRADALVYLRKTSGARYELLVLRDGARIRLDFALED